MRETRRDVRDGLDRAAADRGREFLYHPAIRPAGRLGLSSAAVDRHIMSARGENRVQTFSRRLEPAVRARNTARADDGNAQWISPRVSTYARPHRHAARASAPIDTPKRSAHASRQKTFQSFVWCRDAATTMFAQDAAHLGAVEQAVAEERRPIDHRLEAIAERRRKAAIDRRARRDRRSGTVGGDH